MFKYSLEPQSIGKIYSDSLQLYKQSLGKILIWSIPYAFIMQLLTYSDKPPIETTHANLASTVSTFLPQLFMITPGILLPIFLTPIILIIMITYMHVTAIQTENWPSPSYLLRQFYWRVLGANFLCTFVTFIGVVLLIAVSFLPFFLIQNEGLRYIYTFLIIISDVIVLLIAAIILYPYLAFFNTFIVLENFALIQSIKESFKLATGHWWRTATVLGITQLFTMLITANVIFMIFDHTLTMLIVGIILEAFLIPIPIAFALVLFHDLKIRKTN